MHVGILDVVEEKMLLMRLGNFCKANVISIFMICEMQCKFPPLNLFAQQCGFLFLDHIPTIGLAGGLWIMWKTCNVNPFKLDVLYKSTRFISCHITLTKSLKEFIVVYIYFSANSAFKDEFWCELIA